MPPVIRVIRALSVLSLLTVSQAACLDSPAVLERRLERSYKVSSDSTVRVELSGGSVTAVTGPPGTVQVLLRQVVHTNAGEREAESLLSTYQVSVVQDGSEVRLIARRTRRGDDWQSWGRNRVRLSATVTVPPDVRLDLDTSGGRISIQGIRTAEVRADTSGGSIAVDGGSAPFTLNTSGGSIKVVHALGRLRADTSGGSVAVDYVGASASDIDLSTSGGSIRVGLDPAAGMNVAAGTSGGTVRIEGLSFEGHSQGRSHASGTINGGGTGRLRASTSGGGILVRAASNPRTTSTTDVRD
jgi:hypothetical protein